LDRSWLFFEKSFDVIGRLLKRGPVNGRQGRKLVSRENSAVLRHWEEGSSNEGVAEESGTLKTSWLYQETKYDISNPLISQQTPT
jgi:hypothetical protein